VIGLGLDVAASGAQGVADGPRQRVVAVRDRLNLDPGVSGGGQDVVDTDLLDDGLAGMVAKPRAVLGHEGVRGAHQVVHEVLPLPVLLAPILFVETEQVGFSGDALGALPCSMNEVGAHCEMDDVETVHAGHAFLLG
jgi:hypothetical protein